MRLPIQQRQALHRHVAREHDIDPRIVRQFELLLPAFHQRLVEEQAPDPAAPDQMPAKAHAADRAQPRRPGCQDADQGCIPHLQAALCRIRQRQRLLEQRHRP